MARGLRNHGSTRALFDRPVRAYRHYAARDGSMLAAAVTYFGLLSLFPLILLVWIYYFSRVLLYAASWAAVPERTN